MSLFIHGSLYDITITARHPQGVEPHDPAGVCNVAPESGINGLLFIAERVLAEESAACMYDGVEVFACQECGSDQVEAPGISRINAIEWHFDDNGGDGQCCEYCEDLDGSGSNARGCSLDLREGRCLAYLDPHHKCTTFDRWLAWKLRTEKQDEAYRGMTEAEREGFDAAQIARFWGAK